MIVGEVVTLILKTLKFSRRQTNEVTHTLAREATFLASLHIFNDVLFCISTLIFNEKL